MDWKNNKWVGIGGIIITLICLGLIFIPPILRDLQEKKRQKEIQETEEYKEWKRQEQEAAQRYGIR